MVSTMLLVCLASRMQIDGHIMYVHNCRDTCSVSIPMQKRGVHNFVNWADIFCKK